MLTAAESAKVMTPFGAARRAVRGARRSDDDLAWVVDRFVDAAPGACRRLRRHRAARRARLPAALVPVAEQQPARRPLGRVGRAGASCCSRSSERSGPGRTRRPRVIGAFEAHRDPGQRLGDALVAMARRSAPVSTRSTSRVRRADGGNGHHRRAHPARAGGAAPVAAAARRELDAGDRDGPPYPRGGGAGPGRRAADVIAMARPLVADPDLPNKPAPVVAIASGPAPTSTCIGAIFLNEPVSARSTRTPATSPSLDARDPSDGSSSPVAARPASSARAAWRRAARVDDEAAGELGGMLRIAEAADRPGGGSGTGSSPAEDAGVAIHLGSAVAAAGRRRARGPSARLAWDGPTGRLLLEGGASAAVACDGARQQGGPVDRTGPARGRRGSRRRRRPRARAGPRSARPLPAGRRCPGQRHRDDRRSLPGLHHRPRPTRDRPVHRRTPSCTSSGTRPGRGLASALRSAASSARRL